MLHQIKDSTDRFYNFLVEDPVRPWIPSCWRIGHNREVFVLHDDYRVDAITCVSYQNIIPTSEEELFQLHESSIAVYYTIWSYRPGAGRRLILESIRKISEIYPRITRFVTLSPKTKTAEQFHLRNGAKIIKINNNTINYEYNIDLIKQT